MSGEIMRRGAPVTAVRFADAGTVPNSSHPLLVYEGAVEADPEVIEALFARNGWPPRWRWSIYDFHHFHSTTHEVLGVAAGRARVMMGGPTGEELEIAAGDVIVIPAGVGHKRLSSSADFLVVGGYPPGAEVDLMRGEPGERPGADDNISRGPVPATDPVTGDSGALLELWG